MVQIGGLEDQNLGGRAPNGGIIARSRAALPWVVNDRCYQGAPRGQLGDSVEDE
jgi:hypothetical protein